MVICLERGADLHMAQLMPLRLTFSCFSKIQIGFTFLVPAYLGSPGQIAVKRVCVCVRACACVCVFACSDEYIVSAECCAVPVSLQCVCVCVCIDDSCVGRLQWN